MVSELRLHTFSFPWLHLGLGTKAKDKYLSLKFDGKEKKKYVFKKKEREQVE